jgi:hypothetical protein
LPLGKDEGKREISISSRVPHPGATDYGKQTAEEVKDAASRGAQEPVQEKKGEVLDSIREGAKKGIKKLFKW